MNNEYASAQLEELESAQSNLNNNIENETLYSQFVKVAKKVKSNLARRYEGSWTDPIKLDKLSNEGEVQETLIKGDDVEIEA